MRAPPLAASRCFAHEQRSGARTSFFIHRLQLLVGFFSAACFFF